VAQITLICDRTMRSISLFAIGVGALLSCGSSYASTRDNDDVDVYVSARLSEISQNGQGAHLKYAKLLSKAPASGTIADRLFYSAIQSGDFNNALKAVRAQELQNSASSEGPLLLFADAIRRKDWAMAKLASKELSVKTQYGFMSPLLDGWLNILQNKPANLPEGEEAKEPTFAYFSISQRIFMKLATNQDASAKSDIKSLQSVNTDFVKSLNIRSAPVFLARGDAEFASFLISSAVDGDAIKRLKISKSQSAFTANEGLAALHVHIAKSLLAQKQPEQALVFARVAQYYAPIDDETRLLLGQILFVLKDDVRAQNIFKTIPVTSPYWAESVTMLVREYSEKKNFTAARLLIEKAGQQQPRSVEIALQSAQIFEEIGDLAPAAAIYTDLANSAASTKNSNSQAAVFNMFLANVVEKQGDWQRAKSYLQTAKKLDGSNPYILNSLGYSMLEHNEELPVALSLLRKAHELAPDSAAIADSLGWAYFRTGDMVKAISFLEIAAKKSGNDVTINEHLGDAYWASGRRIDARYAWRVALYNADKAGADRIGKKIDFGVPASGVVRK
jgi:tetratricopeptide (TPR) repeat protein